MSCGYCEKGTKLPCLACGAPTPWGSACSDLLNAELAEARERVERLECAARFAKEALRENMAKWQYKNEHVMLEAFERFEQLGI